MGLALAASAAAMLAFGAKASASGPVVRHAQRSVTSERAYGAAMYVQQQIALGNFVPVCAPPTIGSVSCTALRLRDTEFAPRTRGIDGSSVPGYGPSELQAAYNITGAAKTNSGGLVALVEFGGYPTLEPDLAVYRAEFGLPKCAASNGCLRIVNQNGGRHLPFLNDGAAEQALDVDMVSANCPKCHILVVQASNRVNNSLYIAEKTAATFNPVAISNAWLTDEFAGESNYTEEYFNHPGIAFTAADGDSGYRVYFPAAANTVTAVGGTTLRRTRSARGWEETVWPGTSSGCSLYEPVPSWQATIEQMLGGCSKRLVSDVAYDADPNTGVAVYSSFDLLEPPGWQVYGGTSVGAPAIAAIYALSGDTAGIPASIAYANPTDLYDITRGSDGRCSPAYLCTGEVGYDGPTGLGTPNGLGAF
jgi:subtilase family serine protease